MRDIEGGFLFINSVKSASPFFSHPNHIPSRSLGDERSFASLPSIPSSLLASHTRVRSRLASLEGAYTRCLNWGGVGWCPFVCRVVASVPPSASETLRVGDAVMLVGAVVHRRLPPHSPRTAAFDSIMPQTEATAVPSRSP